MSVLTDIDEALRQSLADRPGGTDLDGQLRPAINPPTIKHTPERDGSTTIRAFTARREVFVNVRVVR